MKKLLLILSLLIFTGCGKSLKDFESKEFVLSNLYNDYKITLSFEGGEIFGFSGVNRYFGRFKVSKDKVEVSDIVMTKMIGSPSEMRVEHAYLDFLGRVVKFEILDNKLVFYTNNNDKLEFVILNEK